MINTVTARLLDAASWGNSEAIRVPKEILRKAGLSQGDIIDLDVNERGHIEVIPHNTFREGARRRRVTFNDLFKDYEGEPLDIGDPWGNDDFIGAEKDVWSS